MDQRELGLVSGIVVGTASVNWGFDPLYTWVSPPPFSQMLDEMAVTGYAGTEISYNFPSDSSALGGMLHERNLRAAATFHALDLRDPSTHAAVLERIAPIANRLQALGADTLIISDKPSAPRLEIAGRVLADGSQGLPEREWQAVGSGLNRVGEFLAKRGMQAVFHPHVGTYVETRAEIDRLVALTDPSLVGLCPDTGHLAYAGVNPESVFVDYAERIRYVHLKDVDGAKLATVRTQHIGFVAAVQMGLFTELGAGAVPISKIISTLESAHYQGWLIVEQDAPPDPLGAAKRNRHFLQTQFGL